MKKSLKVYLAFVLPALIIYTLFMFLPLIFSLPYAFFEWSGFGSKTFVGFSNFQQLFGGGEFTKQFTNALKNNVLFFSYTMLIQNFMALFFAFLLYKSYRGTVFFRTLFFIPATISVVIVGFLWTLIYNPRWGVINLILKNIGLDSLAISWLGTKSTALACVAVANAWQYIGIPIMLFLAGLNSIDLSIMEASSIDGCSSWQKLRYIRLPLMRSVIFIVTVLTFIGNFSSFEIVYATEGSSAGPDYATDILGTLFYRTCFGAKPGLRPEMGMGAAIAFCMFVIITATVLIYYSINSRKTDY